MDAEAQLRVECYAGYRGAETPRAVWLAGSRVAVRAVVRRFREPAGDGFDVELADGRRLTLFLDEGGWRLR